jgi:hypothetical protein
MFKLSRILILCICSFCFTISGCESNNNDNIYIEERETINCDQVKQDFLTYVNENIEDVLSIVDRELKREEGDEEITTQRVLDGIESISFSNQWEEYENILKNNCPETHKEFQDEVSLILLSEILKKYGSELNQENQ